MAYLFISLSYLERYQTIAMTVPGCVCHVSGTALGTIHSFQLTQRACGVGQGHHFHHVHFQ